MKKSLFLFISLFIAVSAFGKEYNQAYEEKLIQDVRAIYTQEAVKTPDNPTGHPVCATSIILQAKYDFPHLSPETQKVLSSLLSRPPDTLLEYTYDSPGGYFKIHFTKDGVNAVYQPNVDNNGNGVPDYVDSCADILDYAWAKEVDTMGYIPPPSDGWYPFYWDNGGDGKYDVYLLNLGTSYLGATYPETTEIAGRWEWTSFLELDNDYLGYVPPIHGQYEWLKVTAAHEFFHAIHFGYDAFEGELVGDTLKPYWMEMTATWMEDQVFDEINDYIYYLRSFLSKPWLSLRNFDGLHPYGACLWPIFLGERFQNIDIIREIWTVCNQTKGDNVLSATDQILRDLYNSSLSDAFQEFSVWNYFTADRANPEIFGFYSEGNLFYDTQGAVKAMETDIHNTYPVTDSSTSQLPENLGANYIVFQPIIDSLGGLRIFFDGDVRLSWEVSLIGNKCIDFPPDTSGFVPDTGNGSNKCGFPPELSDLQLNPLQQKGMGQIFDWTRFIEIAMVIARGDTNSSISSNFRYIYSAEFDDSLTAGWIPPTADRIYQNFPNPFVLREDNSTTKFPLSLKSPSDVKLYIFTTSGELVWEYTWINRCAGEYDINQFPDPEYLPFQWNGKNKKGEYVASGIYIYQIVTENTSEVKKMVVVNER